MFLLLAIVSTIVIGIYGLVKFVHGNDDYWPKHGITLIKAGDVATVWDRYTLSVPPQDIDKRIYDEFKARDPKVKMGGTMEFRKPLLFIFDPDLIKSVAVKDFDHFTNRRTFPLDKDDPSHFGQSLFMLENQQWKDMRSTLSPTFTTGKIRRMFDILNDSAQQMTEYLLGEMKASGSNEIELKEVCGRFTLNVIVSSAFGVESNSFRDKDSLFYRMGQRIQNQFSGLKFLKFMLILVCPILSKVIKMNFFDDEAMVFFGDVIKKTVKHRKESGEKRDDFVQLLLETRSESSVRAEESNLEAFEKDAELKNTKASKVYMTDDLILAQSIL
jgi:cytochrome P450 family 9